VIAGFRRGEIEICILVGFY